MLLDQLLSQFDMEVYWGREGKPCIKGVHQQYNPQDNPQVQQIGLNGSCQVKSETGNSRVHFIQKGKSIIIYKATSEYSNSRLSFSMESSKGQYARAIISYKNDSNYDLQISLNKNGNIELVSNADGSKRYSYNEMINLPPEEQMASLEELSTYLQKADERLIPIIKYCSSIISSFGLSTIASALKYKSGAKVLSRKQIPVNTNPGGGEPKDSIDSASGLQKLA